MHVLWFSQILQQLSTKLDRFISNNQTVSSSAYSFPSYIVSLDVMVMKESFAK